MWRLQQRLEANFGRGCRIAVMLPGKKGERSPIDSKETGLGGDPQTHTGGLIAIPSPPPKRASLTSIGLNLSCEESESPNVQGGTFPIAFDSRTKEWKKDASAWQKEAAEMSDASDRDALNALIRTTNVVNVNAVNSQGWAMTQDDLIGEEKGRRRILSFCLIHASKAICGLGTVALLQDGPKGDLTSHALEIIRSIEFLEDVPGSASVADPMKKPISTPAQ